MYVMKKWRSSTRMYTQVRVLSSHQIDVVPGDINPEFVLILHPRYTNLLSQIM